MIEKYKIYYGRFKNHGEAFEILNNGFKFP